MADGTLHPAVSGVSTNEFVVEYTHIFTTGAFRHSIKFSDFPKIATLKTLFASVVLSNVVAEIRQNTDIGTEDGQLMTNGHVFVAIIPTLRDTDATSGSTSQIVGNVPNKQTFPLSSSQQANEIFNFNLSGYEVDLAQDPRRGAGPVAWLGNSGVAKVGTQQLPICTCTWRVTVTCSGSTPIWQ